MLMKTAMLKTLPKNNAKLSFTIEKKKKEIQQKDCNKRVIQHWKNIKELSEEDGRFLSIWFIWLKTWKLRNMQKIINLAIAVSCRIHISYFKLFYFINQFI